MTVRHYNFLKSKNILQIQKLKSNLEKLNIQLNYTTTVPKVLKLFF